MKEFIDKWKNDQKFKNRIQFCLYGVFVVFVSIYAISGTRTMNDTNDKLEEQYSYKMNINVNDKIYKYEGTKEENEISINKTVDDVTTKYLYKDNKYFKYEENNYLLVEENEIYDVIDFSYLSLDTINKYLNLTSESDNNKIVYLRDIIIGSNSEEYITLETREGYYNIDYTQLMKFFQNDIEKLTVEIIIE